MKRQLPLVFALASAMAFAAMAVSFTNLGAAVTQNGLKVNFTATGLQPNATGTFTATGSVNATYGCFNKAGKNPSAPNKRTTVEDHIEGTGTVEANEKGVATGSVMLEAPTPRNFTCPNGQDLLLSSLTFTGVRLRDRASNKIAIVQGTFRKTFRTIR